MKLNKRYVFTGVLVGCLGLSTVLFQNFTPSKQARDARSAVTTGSWPPTGTSVVRTSEGKGYSWQEKERTYLNLTGWTNCPYDNVVVGAITSRFNTLSKNLDYIACAPAAEVGVKLVGRPFVREMNHSGLKIILYYKGLFARYPTPGALGKTCRQMMYSFNYTNELAPYQMGLTAEEQQEDINAYRDAANSMCFSYGGQDQQNIDNQGYFPWVEGLLNLDGEFRSPQNPGMGAGVLDCGPGAAIVGVFKRKISDQISDKNVTMLKCQLMGGLPLFRDVSQLPATSISTLKDYNLPAVTPKLDNDAWGACAPNNVGNGIVTVNYKTQEKWWKSCSSANPSSMCKYEEHLFARLIHNFGNMGGKESKILRGRHGGRLGPVVGAVINLFFAGVEIYGFAVGFTGPVGVGIVVAAHAWTAYGAWQSLDTVVTASGPIIQNAWTITGPAEQSFTGMFGACGFSRDASGRDVEQQEGRCGGTFSALLTSAGWSKILGFLQNPFVTAAISYALMEIYEDYIKEQDRFNFTERAIGCITNRQYNLTVPDSSVNDLITRGYRAVLNRDPNWSETSQYGAWVKQDGLLGYQKFLVDLSYSTGYQNIPKSTLNERNDIAKRIIKNLIKRDIGQQMEYAYFRLFIQRNELDAALMTLTNSKDFLSANGFYTGW